MAQVDTHHRSTVISEPYPIADTFCSEVVSVQRIGPCVRLVFAVPQEMWSDGDACAQRAIVAKLVLPAEAAETLIAQIGMAKAEAALPRQREEFAPSVN